MQHFRWNISHIFITIVTLHVVGRGCNNIVTIKITKKVHMYVYAARLYNIKRLSPLVQPLMWITRVNHHKLLVMYCKRTFCIPFLPTVELFDSLALLCRILSLICLISWGICYSLCITAFQCFALLFWTNELDNRHRIRKQFVLLCNCSWFCNFYLFKGKKVFKFSIYVKR